MPYTIITTTNARKDIQDAIDWENKRKPGLAKRFLADLDQKLTALESSPHIGSIRYEDIRCITQKFFNILFIT